MRLGRIILLFALVAIVGLVLVYMLGQGSGEKLTDEQVQQTQAAMETIPVVYLIESVGRAEVVTLEKLGVKLLPKIQIPNPDVVFSDPILVAGKMARIDLDAGVFLTESLLMDNLIEGTYIGSEHAFLIPVGMVAVPLPINRYSSVAYGITKGDRVDIIVSLAMVDLDPQFQSLMPNLTAGVLSPGGAIIIPGGGLNAIGEVTLDNIVAQSGSGGITSPAGRAELDALLNQTFYYVPAEAQRARVVTQMIMQDVVVLQVGNFPVFSEDGQEAVLVTPTPEGQQANAAEATPMPLTMQPPDIVTLIMWPQDAVTLKYLVAIGADISLALRPAGDTTRTDTDAVSLQYLMDVYRIPLPVRLPYGTQPRIDQIIPPVLENDRQQ